EMNRDRLVGEALEIEGDPDPIGGGRAKIRIELHGSSRRDRWRCGARRAGFITFRSSLPEDAPPLPPISVIVRSTARALARRRDDRRGPPLRQAYGRNRVHLAQALRRWHGRPGGARGKPPANPPRSRAPPLHFAAPVRQP